MKRHLVALAVAVLTMTTLVGPASAQEAESLQLRIEGLDTTAHPDVTMVVSVPPEMVGKSLTSDAFTVTEAGVQRPVSATPAPTDGLQVVLLLDASGSMGGRPIAAAKDAAQEFLNTMPEGVEVAVVSFANEPKVLSPFTTDADVTSAAITDLRLGRNTALYDGLVAGSELFDGEEGTRRTLVLLSDGGDTASSTTLEEAIVSLLNAEVGFYAVELQSPEYDAEALARLGVATDGIVVAAEDPDGLSSVFIGVASQIVNRYELHYTSETFGRTTVGVEAEVDGLTAAATHEATYPDPLPVAAAPDEATPAPIAEVETAPPAPRAGAIVALNWWQSPTALWVGVLAVFVGLLALLMLTGVTQPKDRGALNVETKRRSGESKGKMLSSLAGQATLLAERTMSRGDNTSKRATTLLEKAGIQLRPGELVVLSISASLVVMAVTTLFAGIWFALLAGVLTLILIRVWIGMKATKRQTAFAEQLPDVLQLMAGSIRSGFGLMQAMDTVAIEIPAPAGDEFQRVKIETQLGRDTNEALLAMSDRVGSEDFSWVVEAIQIHREVGGDLADILDSVMGTVRDRIRTRRRIQTLSAEGRMSGLILSLLPIILGFVMLVLNPDYLSPLLTTGIGQVLMVTGLFLMAVGALWMRRVTSLKF
jgi:tight adherence protein B